MQLYAIILIALAAAFVLWLAVILIRAATFRPLPQEKREGKSVSFDRELAHEHLAELIRCKTVSCSVHEREDDAEFEKLIEKIERFYPRLHAGCQRERHGRRGLLFRWQGKSAGECTVLMAHYDVVPCDESQWTKPPFDAVIEDGVMWGRGTLDTKSTFCGILEAVETMMAQGFTPEHDVYLSFSGGEEIGDDSAPSLVKVFRERNIPIDMVLDEGGAVVENVFPGVKRPAALIGTAEKGVVNLYLSMQSKGGHASSPPPHTLVGELAKAVVAVERRPAKMRISPAAKEMLTTLARHSGFGIKILFANLWCFAPLLDLVTRKTGGELNALVRTTGAFTMMKGSNERNVLASDAEVVANFRIAEGETVKSTVDRVRNLIGNPKISYRTEQDTDPSPSSRTDSEGYKVLKETIAETWQDAIVSPYLMIACSDARHYARISDRVYRFSAMALSGEERKTIHGHDERIRLENFDKVIVFYMRLLAKR